MYDTIESTCLRSQIFDPMLEEYALDYNHNLTVPTAHQVLQP